MALDEALLEAAGARGTTTLRFYRWAEPTLSLGYFQRVADRAEHPATRNCPLVRRQTGGGAIVHDREWTYSFTAPAGSPLAVRAMVLYESIHGALIESLASFCMTARLNAADAPCGEAWGRHSCLPGEQASRLGRQECLPHEPFLCFQRRAAGDVLLGDAKIAGSAQRRRRGALLQHGSLILRASAAAPEIPGLCDLAARDLDAEQLRLVWQAGVARRLRLRLVEGEITDGEQALAERLSREKYGAAEWNEKR